MILQYSMKSALYLTGSKAKSINLILSHGDLNHPRGPAHSPQTNEAPEHASKGHGGRFSHKPASPGTYMAL